MQLLHNCVEHHIVHESAFCERNSWHHCLYIGSEVEEVKENPYRNELRRDEWPSLSTVAQYLNSSYKLLELQSLHQFTYQV